MIGLDLPQTKDQPVVSDHELVLAKTQPNRATRHDNDTIVASEDPPEVQGPCVLQCAVCRQVLGDTCSFIDQDPVAKTITLHHAIGGVLDESSLQTVLDRQAIDFGWYTSLFDTFLVRYTRKMQALWRASWKILCYDNTRL